MRKDLSEIEHSWLYGRSDERADLLVTVKMRQENATGDGEKNAEDNDVVRHEEEETRKQQSSRQIPLAEEVSEETHFQRSIGGEKGTTRQFRPKRLVRLFPQKGVSDASADPVEGDDDE